MCFTTHIQFCYFYFLRQGLCIQPRLSLHRNLCLCLPNLGLKAHATRPCPVFVLIWSFGNRKVKRKFSFSILPVAFWSFSFHVSLCCLSVCPSIAFLRLQASQTLDRGENRGFVKAHRRRSAGQQGGPVGWVPAGKLDHLSSPGTCSVLCCTQMQTCSHTCSLTS